MKEYGRHGQSQAARSAQPCLREQCQARPGHGGSASGRAAGACSTSLAHAMLLQVEKNSRRSSRKECTAARFDSSFGASTGGLSLWRHSQSEVKQADMRVHSPLTLLMPRP